MSAPSQAPSTSVPGGRPGVDLRETGGPDPGSRDFGRLLVGLIVVTLGVLFLLDTADVLRADRAIDRWWPVALIAAGLLTLAERPRATVRGAILTGAGVLLLLFSTHALHENAWNYVWPIVLIAIGLVIVGRWRGHSMPKGVVGDDVLSSTSVFGGAELVSSNQNLRGASLTAVFGGIALDLRDAQPGPEGAAINPTAVFGGIDILVPRGWRITVRSMPIFGGLDDKTDRSVPLSPDAPALRVDAVSIFGGVSITHEK